MSGWARAILSADAVGCAAASVAVLVFPRAYEHVDAAGRSRPIVAAALSASAAIFARGAAHREPDPRDLVVAAQANGAWVATCLAAAPRASTALGRVLVLATAGLDAVAGAVQLALALRARRVRARSIASRR